MHKILEYVKPGLSKKTNVPQSNSFLLDNGYIKTYNDEISVSHPIDLHFPEPFTVQADVLYKFIKKIKNKNATYELIDNALVVTIKNTKASFTISRDIQMPLNEITHGTFRLIPDPEVFIESLAAVRKHLTIARQFSLYNCIHITPAFIEATDGYQLTRVTKNTIPKAIPAFLLPATSVTQLLQYELVTISYKRGWVAFQTKQGSTVSCRTVADTYMELDKYFRVSGKALRFPKTVISLLEHASIIHEVATIKIRGGKITVEAQSSAGKFSAYENIDYAGALRFYVNIKGLIAILKKTQDCIIDFHCIKFVSEDFEHVSRLPSNI